MFRQIKRLGTETAIYGISTILGRFLNFLLVPFYTNVLLPGEYGIVAYVYSLIAFVNVIYSYGMESAYFKYSSTLEIGTPGQNFTTPFLSLTGTSLLFSCVILMLAPGIAGVAYIPAGMGDVVYMAALILALDAIAIIPFAALRMEHKARLFAAIKFLNILVNVLLNIVLLVFFRMGVAGVFLSGVAASAITLLMLLPTVARHLERGFSLPLWKALLKFGLPYIPAGLATMAVQVIDRPILRALTDDATVGIYQANYRLGIFMMLVVSMYDYAWRPFYFSVAKEENAKEIFARVLTYLLLFMSAVFLLLTFFINDIAALSLLGRHLIHPKYWGGLGIVPVVLMGYLFLGISTNLSAGIYIEKKTKYLPVITILGAAINIAANYLLIPRCGMLGAAWATLLAYLAMAAATSAVGRRVYPVRYEYKRLSKVAAALAAVLVIYYSAPGFIPLSAVAALLFKIALLGLFLGLMFYMKFFNSGEISILRGFIGRDSGIPPPPVSAGGE